MNGSPGSSTMRGTSFSALRPGRGIIFTTILTIGEREGADVANKKNKVDVVLLVDTHIYLYL